MLTVTVFCTLPGLLDGPAFSQSQHTNSELHNSQTTNNKQKHQLRALLVVILRIIFKLGTYQNVTQFRKQGALARPEIR